MRSLIPVLLLLASVAFAQVPPPLPNVGPPLLLRLDGTVHRTRDPATKSGFTVASLGFLGGKPEDTRFVGVDDARTVGGDNPVNGKDVLAAVAGFDPNLLVAGSDELVRSLRDLPDGSRVRVEGLVDRGSRTYYLRSVEPR